MNHKLHRAIESKDQIIFAINTILSTGIAPIEFRDQLDISLDEYLQLMNPSNFNINLYTLEKINAILNEPLIIGAQ